jgi:hypothetical protein
VRNWVRLATCCGAALLLPPAGVLAQQGAPRSQDYLFISAVDDARAAWVNPAGLGWIPEASVMAEVVFDRSSGPLRLGQYTVGLNSRGLALTYERDRSTPDSSIGVGRVALGLPLGQGAIGASFTTYGNRHNTGFDLGVRYRLLAELDGAAVLRNLGHPALQGARQPVMGVAGATWTLGRTAEVSAEARAAERLGASGYDVGYRGGIVVRAERPWPLALHALATLSSDGTVQGWVVALMLGRVDHVGLVTGAVPTTGLGPPEQFSAVGVATRRAFARR